MSLCAGINVVVNSNDSLIFPRETCQSCPPLDWWLACSGCLIRIRHDASLRAGSCNTLIDLVLTQSFYSIASVVNAP